MLYLALVNYKMNQRHGEPSTEWWNLKEDSIREFDAGRKFPPANHTRDRRVFGFSFSFQLLSLGFDFSEIGIFAVPLRWFFERDE